MNQIGADSTRALTVSPGTIKIPLWARSFAGCPGSTVGWRHWIKVTVTAVLGVLRGSFSTRHWYVFLFVDATIDNLISSGDLGPHVKIEPRNSFRYFWADPSFKSIDTSGFDILVEQYDRWTGRGSIECVRIEGGSVVSSRTVLKSEHHLAYPTCAVVENQEILTADGCLPLGPVIGTFEDVPRPIEGSVPKHLTDPQLVQNADGHIYLIGTNWLLDERRHGEIYQRMSTSTKPWKLVAQGNGCSWSRGGGTLDIRRGLRAVQNSEGTYGLYVDLFSFSSWPKMEAALLRARVEGSLVGCSGVHTVSWDPDSRGVLLDGWQLRFDPLGWLWHLRELAHLRRCRRRMVQSLSRAWIDQNQQTGSS